MTLPVMSILNAMRVLYEPINTEFEIALNLCRFVSLLLFQNNSFTVLKT